MDDLDYHLLDDFEEGLPFYDEIYSSDGSLWYENEDTDSMSASISSNDLYELCILPSLQDAFAPSAKLLLWSLLFRVSTQIVTIPVTLCHILSAVSGLVVLHQFFQSSTVFIFSFAFGSYLTLLLVFHIMKKNRGYFMGIMCIVFLIICELFIVNKNTWHKIRGAQMIISMKIISLAFDTDFGILQKLPNYFEFLGYVLSVGTCVFGPWVSYKDYILIYNKPSHWNFKWIWKIALNFMLAMLYLSISTCWIPWLISDNSWRWWLAYRDALSFRFSHYFISYLSEASALISGHGWHDSGDWDVPVTKPLYIEMPRSLVQVVVYWNMPMHNWLKNHVFRTTKPLGSFAAIFATYIVSSLLHGINFQLAAVLLSLGVYTYVEYVLRQKLSSIFSACILARPCRRDCGHRYRDKWPVLLTNFALGVIVMFHLSYLGLMFDSSSKLQEEGYNYSHTLSKWSSLGFASHWLILGKYIFYLLI